MDLVVTMEKFPNSGETIGAHDFNSIPGGKGLNQAIAASRAGTDVAMIGALGNDANSELLLKLLESEDVDVSGIQKYNGPCGVAIVEVDSAGANRIAIVPGANEKLSFMSDSTEAYLNTLDAVVLGPLENPISEVEKFFFVAKSLGLRTILNPAPVQSLSKEFLSSIDILIPNQHEAEALTGIEISNRFDAEAAALLLLKNGHEVVVITMGDQGAILVSHQEVIYQPAFEIIPIDTTAAGDTFCGFFAAELGRGSNFQECLRFASAAAAISTTSSGASSSIPTRKRVMKFLEDFTNTH